MSGPLDTKVGRCARCELRREAREDAWSMLEERRDVDGLLRHYLDGKPIDARGTALELQAWEERTDTEGYAYNAPLPRGILVRYDATPDGNRVCAILHAHIGGHLFIASCHPFMGFRWPQPASSPESQRGGESVTKAGGES